jgi:hypothetical protein
VRAAAVCALAVAGLGATSSTASARSAPQPIGDRDGDGKTDKIVWRPSAGTFYWLSSQSGSGFWAGWGVAGDIPVSGDFDGDHLGDWAIWRPSTGQWWIWLTGPNTAYWVQWGQAGDIPVPGDYDGDGKTDLAVWRTADHTWYVINSSTGAGVATAFGAQGDIPAPGDFDGDGRTDKVVWRPSNATWYGLNSSNAASWSFQWGVSTDIPVAGYYDADSQADFAVWRPSNGTWYVRSTHVGTQWTTQWGLNGDVPVPGDYDGDGLTDRMVWRPSDGKWYLISSSTGATSGTQWGFGGANQGGDQSDVPLPYAAGGQTELDMPALGQAMSNWCWAASEQMAAGWSGVSLPECSLANAQTGRSDCCNASPPAACNSGGCFGLTSHGFTETDLWQTTCGGLAATGNAALSFAQLKAELAANRPVAFAWSWTGGGGHEMEVVGAWTTTAGQQWVEINDPEPGPLTGTQSDLLYTAWVSGSTYVHQRDTYNIKKN